MTVAALITQGIGPGSSITYVLTGGLDIGAAPEPPPVILTYSGYPVRNYVLRSLSGIERALKSKSRRERSLKPSPPPSRNLRN